MTTEHGSILVPAPAEVICGILLQPLQLPEWNPAFRSVDGPAEPSTTQRYSLVSTHGLRGSLWYPEIGEDRIDTSWTVPGFSEDGTWEMRTAMYGTEVRHRFNHAGPLAVLLRKAYRGVADLRLQRLAARAAAVMASGSDER